jgi:hypothetical protein
MVAVLPIVITAVIYRSRQSIDRIKTRYRIGYMTLGYNEAINYSVYWDQLQMAKKIASIFILSYLSQKTSTQGLVMILIVLVYITLLRMFHPYKSSIPYIPFIIEKLHHVDSRSA